MNKRKLFGAILIIAPFAGIIASMSAYAIVAFILAQTNGNPDAQSVAAIGAVFNILLGVLGLASLLGFFIGIPVGVYLLATEGKKAG